MVRHLPRLRAAVRPAGSGLRRSRPRCLHRLAGATMHFCIGAACATRSALIIPANPQGDGMTIRPSRPAVLDQIGNTPLVQVTRLDTGPCTLFLKLENQNPGGSIKD